MVTVVVDIPLLVVSRPQYRYVRAVHCIDRPSEGLRGLLECRFCSGPLLESVGEFNLPTQKSSVDGVSHSPYASAYRRLTERNVHVLPDSTLVGTRSKKPHCCRVLRTAFRTHGLCTTIVSDNGTAFTSAEFATFLRERGITHLCSPPYFPSSNRPGELEVRLVKSQFRRLPPGSERLANALASVRLLPRADGLSPAARLMGRQPLILLAQLRPRRVFSVDEEKFAFSPGQRVYFREYPLHNALPKWSPGVVVRAVGHKLNDVQTESGFNVRRHFLQMRRRPNLLLDRGGRVIRACNQWRRDHGLPVSSSSSDADASPPGSGPTTPDRDVSPATERFLLASPKADSGTSSTPPAPAVPVEPQVPSDTFDGDVDGASGVAPDPTVKPSVPGIPQSSTEESSSRGRRRRKRHRRGGRKGTQAPATSPQPAIVPAPATTPGRPLPTARSYVSRNPAIQRAVERALRQDEDRARRSTGGGPATPPASDGGQQPTTSDARSVPAPLPTPQGNTVPADRPRRERRPPERLGYEWRIHYLPSRGEIVAAPAGASAWEWLWVVERGAWVHLSPIPLNRDPRVRASAFRTVQHDVGENGARGAG